jgi:pimeloyl-ACP methyl ester carboxylesterase
LISPHVEPVEIAVASNTVLRGELRRVGPDWALLVHDLGEDLDAWCSLPSRLTEQGLSVLAVDLRGHGTSDGEADAAAVSDDIIATVDYATAAGAARLYMGAAGQAGRCALELAADRPDQLAGLFLVSPAIPLRNGAPMVPKLLLIGQGEAGEDEISNMTTGRSVLARLPAQSHGLGLLRGSLGEQVVDYVVRFLADIRRNPPLALRPRREFREELS